MNKNCKHKDPKCDEQDGCVWVKNKGCLEEERKEESTATVEDYKTFINTSSANISGYRCQHINIDGTDYWIHIDIGNIDPTLIDEIKPIYKNIDIVNAPDGIYTWVLLLTKVGPQIYFREAMSVYELESKHSAILPALERQGVDIRNRDGEVHIIFAGELKKENGNYIFNFKSGTYMLEGIYEEYYSTEKETGQLEQLEENTLFRELIHIINDNILGISMDKIIFSSNEHINPEQIPITLDFLNMLDSIGIPIKLFTSIEDCIVYDKNYELIPKKKIIEELELHRLKLLKDKNRIDERGYNESIQKTKDKYKEIYKNIQTKLDKIIVSDFSALNK